MKKLFGVGKKKPPKEEGPPPPSLKECSDNVLTLNPRWAGASRSCRRR